MCCGFQSSRFCSSDFGFPSDFSVRQPVPTLLTPRQCLGLALAAYLLAVYGSFVPFRFTACSWPETIAKFDASRSDSLRLSRSDFAANILLFVPIGFFLTGAVSSSRGRSKGVSTGVAVVAMSICMSVGVELGQVWFPPRTPSLVDVGAQTLGTIAGWLAWLMVGDRLRNLGGTPLASGRSFGAHEACAFGYFAALLLIHAMPLDLTISPGELYQKVKEGRMRLLPTLANPPELMADCLWNIAYFAPAGYLIATEIHRRREHGRRERGRRNCRPTAPQAATGLACGLCLCTALETVQVFVRSRSADVTDILTGTAGVAAGGWLFASLDRGWGRRLHAVCSGAPVRFVAFAGWLVVLGATYWQPFHFETDPAAWTTRLQNVHWVPFADYYVDSEYHAFDELHRKFLLFVPGGLLLSAPPSDRRFLGLWPYLLPLAGVAFVCEAVQIALPGHYPSASDVLMQTLGGIAGCWLARSARGQNPRSAAPAAAADNRPTFDPRSTRATECATC
jgi:VanZ family protein